MPATIDGYINRGEFKQVGVAANFDAEFGPQWGSVKGETIKQTSSNDLYTLLDDAGAIFTPLSVEPGFDNPVTGQHETDPDKKYILNGNNGAKLGLVGKDYNPKSHYDTLVGGFGELTNSGYKPTKVLNFDGGRKVMVIFFGGVQTVADRLHKKYVAYYNALDGSSTARFGGTDICVICRNTFARAKRQIRESGLSARHTQNMDVKLDEIRRDLGIVEAQMADYYHTLQVFAGQSATPEIIDQFTNYLIPDGKKDAKRENDGPANRRAEISTAVFKSLAERNDNDLTIYDIFQGATRYATYRTQKRNDLAQVEYVTDGPGATFTNNAFDWLKKFVDNR